MPADSPSRGWGLRSGWVALWLFGVFFFLYLGTAKAILEYGDDVSMLEVSNSLIRQHRFAVPTDTPGSAIGVDGRSYSKYGIGQSLLALPFVALGDLLERAAPASRIIDPAGFVRASTEIYVVCLVGVMMTAGSVALTYLTCRRLSLSEAAAIVAAASLGLSTFAWHYARTFMSEPTFMFALLLAFYAWLRYREGGAGWLLISAVAASFGVLVRVAGVVDMMPIGVGVVWVALTRGDSGRLTRAARDGLLWIAPVILALVAVGLYNALRFGNPFETGYQGAASAFTTPLLVGLYGLTLSTGKGIAIYAPIVIAGLLGWFRLRSANLLVAYVILAIIAVQFFFYAPYFEWFGGGVWGPRFVVPSLPFILIGLGALINGGMGTIRWAWLVALEVLSAAIQVVSVLEPYVPYEAKMEATPELFERLLWNPIYSPVAAETLQLLHGDYSWDLAPHYYSSQLLAWLQGGALVLSGGVLLVGLLVLWKRQSLLARRKGRHTDAKYSFSLL